MFRGPPVTVQRRALSGWIKGLNGPDDAFRVRADQDVPTGLYRLDPLGLLAQGNARRAQTIGLFLHPARVGEQQARMLLQDQDVKIAYRLDQAHIGGDIQFQARDLLAGTRVRRKDHRLVRPTQGRQDARQILSHIGVAGTVNGRQQVMPGGQTQVVQDGGPVLGQRQVVAQPIIHHVADPVNIARNALGGQVARGGLGGAKQHVGDAVGEHAIDLFGHGLVKAAQPGLDVDQGQL